MSETSKPGDDVTQAPEDANLLEGALYWAEEWDLPVFPLYGIEFDDDGKNGTCTCPLGKNCDSPGKHPRMAGWQDAATTDPPKIKEWWAEHPDSNVGLLTGGPLQVIDIDSSLGEQNLAEHWAPPETLEVVTSKGRHLYFVTPDGFHAGNTQGGKGDRTLGKGIDTRGDGGYVVTAPSRHASGASYELVEREPAELPKAVAARLQSIGTVRLVPPTVERRSQHPHANAQYADMVTTIVNRIRIANSGRRHMTVLNGVRWLAGYFHLQEGLTSEEVFKYLHDAINEVYTDDKGRRGGYRTALDAWNHGLCHPFNGLPGTTNRIEEADERPYMLSQGNGYWIATSGHDRTDTQGSFSYYPEKKAVGALMYEWPGIRCWVPKAKGDGNRPMKPDEAFAHYGQAYAEQVTHSYTDRACFDPETRTITLPARFRPPPDAKYHAEIDEWLRLLSEDTDDTEKLLDWIATAPMVDQPTSALVITGPGGVGKQMIVLGLCAYFGVKPVSYDIAVSQYNWPLAASPVVWLDEVARHLGRTGGFRRLVANSSHTIEQKYQPVGVLEGSPRLLAFSNGPDPFGLAKEDLTLDDEEAIGARLLHIGASMDARVHLEKLGGRRFTARERWVEEKLPQHIRWLEENREVEHNSRLLVPGDAQKWARRVSSRTGTRGQVLEFLQVEVERMRHSNGSRFTGAAQPCYMDEDGGVVWVNNKALRGAWTRTFDEVPPSHLRITKALQGLSKREKPERKRFGNLRPQCFPVPLDLIEEGA